MHAFFSILIVITCGFMSVVRIPIVSASSFYIFHHFQECIFRLEKIQVEQSARFGNISVSHKTNSDGGYSLNFTMNLFKNCLKARVWNSFATFNGQLMKNRQFFLQVAFGVTFSAKKTFKCEETPMTEGTFDMCKLTERTLNSIFINTVWKFLAETADFELKCPYPARQYKITNLTAYVPAIIPFPKGFACVTQKISCTFPNVRGFQLLAFLKYFGSNLNWSVHSNIKIEVEIIGSYWLS